MSDGALPPCGAVASSAWQLSYPKIPLISLYLAGSSKNKFVRNCRTWLEILGVSRVKPDAEVAFSVGHLGVNVTFALTPVLCPGGDLVLLCRISMWKGQGELCRSGPEGEWYLGVFAGFGRCLLPAEPHRDVGLCHPGGTEG